MTGPILPIAITVVLVVAVAWALREGRRYRRDAERLIADYDARLDDADIQPVDEYTARYLS